MSGPVAAKRLSKTVIESSTLRQHFVCFQCRHKAAFGRGHPQTIAQTSTSAQQRRHASSKEPITERIDRGLQRKVWGRDDPPVQKDPYSKEESEALEENVTAAVEEREQLDKKISGNQQMESLDVSSKEPAYEKFTAIKSNDESIDEEEEPYFVAPTPNEAAQEEGYKPATSLDQLEPVGGSTGWWEDAWDRENQFQGYVFEPFPPVHKSFISALYL